MKNFKKKSNKKLAAMVGMALSVGVAFGMMPSDVAEAANYSIVVNAEQKYEITDQDAQLSTPMIVTYDELMASDGQFMQALQAGGNTVTIANSDTASALSGENITLGAHTTVNVQGSTNHATLVSGDASSTVKISGTAIEGTNVNLASIDVSVNGGKVAKVNVTGQVGSVNVTAQNGTGSVVFGNDVKVGSLKIQDGAKLSVKSGTQLTVDKLTLNKGAEVTSGSVAVKEIIVDATDPGAAAQVGKLQISSADGSAVKLTVENSNSASADALAKINSAAQAAASAGGADIDSDINMSVSVKANGDGTYTVGTGGEPVQAGVLADAVANAYAGGANQVTLDKASAQALSEAASGVNIPAGKTMIVKDGTATVSATPTNNAVISVEGNAISADNGTKFDNIVVDAGNKVIKNNIKNAEVTSVVVKSGTLDTQSVTVDNLVVEGGNITASSDTGVGEGVIKADNATIRGGSLTASSVTAETVTVAGGATVKADTIEATEAEFSGHVVADVKAGTVTIGAGASISKGSSITTDKLVVSSADDVAKLNVKANGTNPITVEKADGTALTGAEAAKIAANVSSSNSISYTDASGKTVTIAGNQTSGISKPDAIEAAAVESAKAVIAENAKSLAVLDAAAVAQADPFAVKLPSASDISKLANTPISDLNNQYNAIEGAYDALNVYTGNEELLKQLEAQKAAIPTTEQARAEKVAAMTAAVQQAGKTAAAPSVTSARAANVVTNVMTQNVVTRTAEIRGFASAIDEGRPAPEKVWFQYKHTNMDVDGGDVYSKSTINTNNFQLGYDTQIGANDYLGAYIGTTTGNADFRGPARDGRVDIEGAFDFGVYGTHMLPNDQYIDYMIHTGKFDSKMSDVKYGTKDTGLMVGYGLKLAQTENLTLNPYVQLSYDKVDVDSYTIAGNTVNSDASNNWTAKLGLNLVDASGFYGGLAYSRGLSGSYNAYLNGVPMPTQDNNANVIYLSMGYRAMMSKNALLDLSMEKTFADYKGWTAAGKINFYF